VLVFWVVYGRYLSVILTFILGKNKKVEQHIRKKTHKSNVLGFWIEGGVIRLYVDSVLILVRSPRCLPLQILPRVSPYARYHIFCIVIIL